MSAAAATRPMPTRALPVAWACVTAPSDRAPPTCSRRWPRRTAHRSRCWQSSRTWQPVGSTAARAAMHRRRWIKWTCSSRSASGRCASPIRAHWTPSSARRCAWPPPANRDRWCCAFPTMSARPMSSSGHCRKSPTRPATRAFAWRPTRPIWHARWPPWRTHSGPPLLIGRRRPHFRLLRSSRSARRASAGPRHYQHLRQGHHLRAAPAVVRRHRHLRQPGRPRHPSTGRSGVSASAARPGS